jgi:hypothetical protein
MNVNRDALISKIQALLSKTIDAGCTEEEALSALAKARGLMDAYEISEDELKLTKAEAAILRSEPAGANDPHRIKYLLSHSVAQFCACRAWKNTKKGGLTFCGLQSDVRLATWLLDTLTAFVQSELANHLMSCLAPKGERRFVINGFVQGCTARISQRLDALKAASEKVVTANGRELVVVKGTAISAKMESAGIKTCTRTISGRRTDPSSYHAGRSAGERASFGRPVTGPNKTLRLN